MTNYLPDESPLSDNFEQSHWRMLAIGSIVLGFVLLAVALLVALS